MPRPVIVIFSVLLAVTVVCDSARILAVLTIPAFSHQVVYRPVTLELAKRGHEVVVITTHPMFEKGKAPANFTEIDVHDITHSMFAKFYESSSKAKNSYEKLLIARQQLLKIFEKQLEIDEVHNAIYDKRKYDLLILAAYMRPALVLSHVLKIPTIQFSSFGALPGVLESMGAPTHRSLYPLSVRQRIINMTLWEKIVEYYNNYFIETIFADDYETEHEVMKKIAGSDVPKFSELRNNVDMYFFNVYSVWDWNRPLPPNLIYLGGLHLKPPKPLPNDLKSYLDSSTNGVIYMSLGTNVKPSMLPPEKLQILLKVFSSLPYNVLFKWDKDELEGRPSNVNVSKWFPQSDLLHHPNIKLFITQGGLQSTDEAISAGVPMIAIPMLGDQWYNAELYILHKIGAKLDIETMTEEDVRNTINTVLKDESYRANIDKLRTVMKDQPMTSLERAIWWTEYVIRHKGAKHLRPPTAGISWAEYYELEFVISVLIALIFSAVALIILVYLAVKSLLSKFRYTKLKYN